MQKRGDEGKVEELDEKIGKVLIRAEQGWETSNTFQSILMVGRKTVDNFNKNKGQMLKKF